MIVVRADQAPTSSLEQAENARGSKSSSTTAFFDSIGQTQKSGRNWEVRFALKNRRRQPGLSGPKSATNEVPAVYLSRFVFDSNH